MKVRDKSNLDECIPALHFVAGQFKQYLFILPEVFDHKPNPRVLLFLRRSVLLVFRLRSLRI